MGNLTIKPASGGLLKLQDAGSTDRIQITDGGSTVLYEDDGNAALTIDTDGNVVTTNIKATSGQSLTIKDEDGNSAITIGTDNTAHTYLSLNFGSYHGDAGGAGSGSRTGNTLDDYEEGTWSPTMSDGANNPTGYSSRVGFYTKIGRLVYCSFRVSASGFDTWTTGTLFIVGLPFTSANNAIYGPCSIFGLEFKANPSSDFRSQITPDTTAITLLTGNNKTTAHAGLAASTHVDTGTDFRGTLVYEAQ